MSLQIFNYLKMKAIEWEQYKLFVLINSVVRRKNNQFVQDHTNTASIII